MIDLLADARERLAHNKSRAQTHSDICHRWHDVCMIERLVKRCEAAEAEVDRLRSLTRFQDGVIRSGDTATLTTDERDVLNAVAEDAAYRQMARTESVVRGLLERLGGDQ